VEGVDTNDTTILANKPIYKNALKNYEDSSAYDSPATPLASSSQVVSYSTICLLFKIPTNYIMSHSIIYLFTVNK